MHVRVLWTGEPASKAIISWSTAWAGNSHRVQYDTASHGGDTGKYRLTADAIQSHSLKLGGEDADAGISGEWHAHHAELTGLSPSATYHFIVSSSGRASKEYHFITAPADDRPFFLIAGSDSRMGRHPRNQLPPHLDRQSMNRRIARLVEENQSILAMVHGGDFCRSANWLHLKGWFDDNEMIVSSKGRILPLIIARGNHDQGDGFEQNFWLGAGGRDGGPRYYHSTLIGSSVVLLSLDTESSLAGDQLEWLKKNLAMERPKSRWLIVQYHRSAFPAVKDFHRQEFAAVRKYWVPEFERLGVDLVLESDGHALKRTLPIRGGVQHDKGVVYIGEGGLGAPQREPDTARWFLKKPGRAMSAHHFWLLEFGRDSLAMEAIGADGEALDRHALRPRMLDRRWTSTSR